MGSDPYWYFVEYEADFNSALQKLRALEFKAGRYNPVVMFPDFPITDATPAPGAEHNSIDEAMEEAMEEGTRSILDLQLVAPTDDFCVARTLTLEELEEYFGTDQPTREQVENCDELYADVERGKGVCIPIYKDGVPVELFFLGYSFD